MNKPALTVDPGRIRPLNTKQPGDGPVIYWMSRDQRVRHNWALLHACEEAARLRKPVEVVFTLAPSFLDAPVRHYDFMFRGLMAVEESLTALNIPFAVIVGEPAGAIADHAARRNAAMIVTDFSPLKLTRAWKNSAAGMLDCSMVEVDAHNIVPCWIASSKQEFAARTIRPKLWAHAKRFLTPFPEPAAAFQHPVDRSMPVDWNGLMERMQLDRSVRPVDRPEPGEAAAEKQLGSFIAERLGCYASGKNDPNSGCVSRLSPYLHFGQLSAQHTLLSVAASGASAGNRDSFIEELFIRRELAENYCFYNAAYDSYEGIPAWAKESLREHGADAREFCYSIEAFERAETHDPLWNAAQSELAGSGVMHGYMRMYWAKKILEWSRSPEAAFDIAVRLNDRYALDGRDPNGYTGIAWSIGGLHDRPWFERPVFGKIRYMNAAGCARKFDVRRYIETNKGGSLELPL